MTSVTLQPSSRGEVLWVTPRVTREDGEGENMAVTKKITNHMAVKLANLSQIYESDQELVIKGIDSWKRRTCKRFCYANAD